MYKRQTQYRNPSGLDAEGHYSSARDLATLAAHALENEDFADIVSKQEIRMAFGNPPYNRSLYTTNKLLERYPYAIGVKMCIRDSPHCFHPAPALSFQPGELCRALFPQPGTQ